MNQQIYHGCSLTQDCFANSKTKPLFGFGRWTITGSVHNCWTWLMLCCCLRAAKLGHSSMRCVIVWGLTWHRGQRSVRVLFMRSLYELRFGWWPQRSLERCTLSDLESCVSVLLMLGGGVSSILLFGRLLSACLVRCVWMCFLYCVTLVGCGNEFKILV